MNPKNRGTFFRRLIPLVALLLVPPPSVCPSAPVEPLVRIVSFEDFLRTRAYHHAIPVETVRGMIRVESSGNPNARGRRGEIGLLQVKVSTAREALRDPSITVRDLTNPILNVEAGLTYLANLSRQFRGNLKIALVAYNRGPAAVRKSLRERVPVRYTYARRVQRHGSRNLLSKQEELMNKISVVVPSYRNPSYLRLALSSLLSGRENPENEIVVVIDGFREEYEELMREFAGKVRFVVLKHNTGMMNAINVGVSRSLNPYVLVTNEDIVAGRGWDHIIEPDLDPGRLLGIDCIEPLPGSLFGFPAFDAGRTLKEFRSEDFHSFEMRSREDRLDPKSYVIPFAIHRADFMRIGGFDASNFSGPYMVDDDFFLRVQLAEIEAVRTLKVRFYHFSGKSTKYRDDALPFVRVEWKQTPSGSIGITRLDTDDKNIPNFFEVERANVAEFVKKWGFRPARSRELNSVVAVGAVPEYLEGRVEVV